MYTQIKNIYLAYFQNRKLNNLFKGNLESREIKNYY